MSVYFIEVFTCRDFTVLHKVFERIRKRSVYEETNSYSPFRRIAARKRLNRSGRPVILSHSNLIHEICSQRELVVTVEFNYLYKRLSVLIIKTSNSTKLWLE